VTTPPPRTAPPIIESRLSQKNSVAHSRINNSEKEDMKSVLSVPKLVNESRA